MIYATDYGAAFDNNSDDTAAIQTAIDAAHNLGEPLILPGRTAIISRELDLRGRTVQIHGTIGKTELRATRRGMTMINIQEATDEV